MNKFSIGDIAFFARAGQMQVWVTCPECLGSGRLRVILGDNTEASIACACCERGYEGSPGLIQTWAFKAEVEEVRITGLESDLVDGCLRTRYKVNSWIVDEGDLWRSRHAAEVRGTELVTEHEAEEKKRLGYKEKQTKTWAWNVAYWRKQIRDAKEQIERATERLNMAPKNLKEADKAEVPQ